CSISRRGSASRCFTDSASAFDPARIPGDICDNPVRSRAVSVAATHSFVLEHPPAEPAVAERHFLSKLALETDPADVHLDLEPGHPASVVVDTRSPDVYARATSRAPSTCRHAPSTPTPRRHFP